MQLHKIEPIGLESLQTALNAFQDRRFRPVRAAFYSVWMTALGEEIKFAAPFAHGLTDQLLAVVITLGGVDDVQSGIERAI